MTTIKRPRPITHSFCEYCRQTLRWVVTAEPVTLHTRRNVYTGEPVVTTGYPVLVLIPAPRGKWTITDGRAVRYLPAYDGGEQATRYARHYCTAMSDAAAW